MYRKYKDTKDNHNKLWWDTLEKLFPRYYYMTETERKSVSNQIDAMVGPLLFAN